MNYDYLIVGAGLYGAVFAQEAKKAGKKCLVIDKRPQIAGNVYTEDIEGIHVHKYGAHIFHTNNKEVWDYVNQFAEFNRFTNSPVANYHGELYSLPFNMYTFNKMWGVVTPEEAAAKIEEQKKAAGITEPKNLEEQAISLIGTDIYEKLVKGYTEKQWGRPCTELPAFIIKRLPVRLTFDNNYFNALYQGIPTGGYTALVSRMLEGVEVRLNTDYLAEKDTLDSLADRVVYTGALDAFEGTPIYIHPSDDVMLLDSVWSAGTMIGDTAPRPAATGYVQEGSKLHLAGLDIAVLHTPGHTIGSVCYAIGDVLFTGDTMFCGGYGRTDLPGGDEDELARSLHRLLRLEKNWIICPGHGEPSTLKEEKEKYR